jgi:hypothetical protein
LPKLISKLCSLKRILSETLCIIKNVEEIKVNQDYGLEIF